MSKAALTTRPMRRDLEDLERFSACFVANGIDKPLPHLRWQYLDNPVDRTYVDLSVPADDPNRFAATYAVFPVRVSIHGAEHLAVQSLDTLTDEAFRGQGLFLKLAKSNYARCEAEGVAFVYGFPNGNSAHGFFRRLDWTPLDPVPYLFRPLRTGYFARRLPKIGAVAGKLPDLPLPLPRAPRLPATDEIRTISSFSADFDDLWREFVGQIGVAVIRDTAYLNWRFARRPKTAYQSLAYFQNGRLMGFITFLAIDKHGGRVGYIMEAIHRPGATGVGRALMATALRTLAADGVEVVLAWNLPHSPNRAAYTRAGFLPLPRKLWPIELHFGVRALAAPAGAALANRANWYLSYADADTV